VFWSGEEIRSKRYWESGGSESPRSFFYLLILGAMSSCIAWAIDLRVSAQQGVWGPIMMLYCASFILTAKAKGRPKAQLPLEIMLKFSVCLLEYRSGYNKPVQGREE